MPAGGAFLTGVQEMSQVSIFGGEQAFCEDRVKTLRPMGGRMQTKEEIDRLKMIMLSQSPVTFPIHQKRAEQKAATLGKQAFQH